MNKNMLTFWIVLTTSLGFYASSAGALTCLVLRENCITPRHFLVNSPWCAIWTGYPADGSAVRACWKYLPCLNFMQVQNACGAACEIASGQEQCEGGCQEPNPYGNYIDSFNEPSNPLREYADWARNSQNLVD